MSIFGVTDWRGQVERFQVEVEWTISPIDVNIQLLVQLKWKVWNRPSIRISPSHSEKKLWGGTCWSCPRSFWWPSPRRSSWDAWWCVCWWSGRRSNWWDQSQCREPQTSSQCPWTSPCGCWCWPPRCHSQCTPRQILRTEMTASRSYLHMMSPAHCNRSQSWLILLKTKYFYLILSFFKWSLILSITALKAALMFFVADGKFHFIPLRKNKIQTTSPQYNVQN